MGHLMTEQEAQEALTELIWANVPAWEDSNDPSRLAEAIVKFWPQSAVVAAPSDAQVDEAIDILNDPQYEYAAMAMREILRRAMRGTSQLVQVEVTEQAVVTLAKYMANVASDWTDICDDDDHPLEHSNWEAYTDDARAALAALGGGDQ